MSRIKLSRLLSSLMTAGCIGCGAGGIMLKASSRMIFVWLGVSGSTTIPAYSESGYSGDITLRVNGVAQNPCGSLRFNPSSFT